MQVFESLRPNVQRRGKTKMPLQMDLGKRGIRYHITVDGGGQGERSWVISLDGPVRRREVGDGKGSRPSSPKGYRWTSLKTLEAC